MKRIFPVIAVLISLSLLGLIYFQALWLSTAVETKQKQLRENIFVASTEAAENLMEDYNRLLSLNKPNKNLFNDDNLTMEVLRPSVIERYSKDEINAIIRKSMNKHFLEGIYFEFAVSDNSINGDQIQSDNFMKYFLDSTHNTNFVIPLESPPGSDYENITKEEYLVIIVPNQEQIIYKEIFWYIIGTALFTLIIITAFFLTIRTLIRQKKLSEIKSDFINNMTHEFKTPIATISLAVDALRNEKVIGDREKSAYFTNIIKEENIRMNKQVEVILQASLLDKKEIELNIKEVSAQDLIKKSIDNIKLQLQEKQGQIIEEFSASNDTIQADEDHFVNLIGNLLDNAIKYSKPEGLVITVTTENRGNDLMISIKDNGIGMTRETLNRIFEKFYRAHTGNIHNVKGFGLGLGYVKTMVEAQKGKIKAESMLGKGSTFIITLPLVG
jgi:two-component system phosphate regulon sensor histidine kinase PhoR